MTDQREQKPVVPGHIGYSPDFESERRDHEVGAVPEQRRGHQAALLPRVLLEGEELKRTFVEFMHIGEHNNGNPQVQFGFIKERGAPAIAVTGPDGVTRLAELPWKDVHLEHIGDATFRASEEQVAIQFEPMKWRAFEICEDPVTPDPESSE